MVWVLRQKPFSYSSFVQLICWLFKFLLAKYHRVGKTYLNIKYHFVKICMIKSSKMYYIRSTGNDKWSRSSNILTLFFLIALMTMMTTSRSLNCHIVTFCLFAPTTIKNDSLVLFGCYACDITTDLHLTKSNYLVTLSNTHRKRFRPLNTFLSIQAFIVLFSNKHLFRYVQHIAILSTAVAHEKYNLKFFLKSKYELINHIYWVHSQANSPPCVNLSTHQNKLCKAKYT